MNGYHGRDTSYRIQPLNGHNYHNDFITRSAPYVSAIAYSLASSVFVYYLLAYLNFIPPSAFSRLAWKFIVMITPSSVVFALDQNIEQSGDMKDGLVVQDPTGATAKEQAIRRILGWDKESFFSVFSQRKTNLGKRTASLAPPGLGNMNNSCYQNSVIQGLASLRRLDSFLEDNIRDLDQKHEMMTHISLKETIGKLNEFFNSGYRMWLPRELKSMSSWQQQDAQEYYSKIIEQIDKEVNHASKLKISDNGFKLDTTFSKNGFASSSAVVPKHGILRRTGFTELAGPFDNPLEGLAAQRVGCTTCGYCEGLSLIPFTCLTVPLPQRQEHDVGSCLDEYTALEFIEGVECAKCTALHVEAGILKVFDELESRDLSQLEPSERAHHETMRTLVERRLEAVKEALRNEDFFEKTLSEVFRLNSKQRVSSTKSRQSVIARAPKSLVIHINRSMFDELTGRLMKNPSRVTFPDVLDLDEWCLGSKNSNETSDGSIEDWDADPKKSMLSSPDTEFRTLNRQYELRAAITHYGRHDDGHYVCYRKFAPESLPLQTGPLEKSSDFMEAEGGQWFELNDAYVTPVSQDFVMSQGGVFMLFYEMIEPSDTPATSDVSELSSNKSHEDISKEPRNGQTDSPD